MRKTFHTLHKKKSQVALEFISVYMWAFMAIFVAIGTLYYFGVFDFGKYFPQNCIFPSQFKCLDFSLQPSKARIKLVNNIGEDIEVTAMDITNDANPPFSCTPPATPVTWAHATTQDFLFSSCSGGGYIPNARAELKVSMNYYAISTPSKPNHAISGKIYGKILSS